MGQSRWTVNLVDASVKALHGAAALVEERHTNVFNRALQLYALVIEAASDVGERTTVVKRFDLLDLTGDGATYEIQIRRIDDGWRG
jgi:hypothetical protein